MVEQSARVASKLRGVLDCLGTVYCPHPHPQLVIDWTIRGRSSFPYFSGLIGFRKGYVLQLFLMRIYYTVAAA